MSVSAAIPGTSPLLKLRAAGRTATGRPAWVTTARSQTTSKSPPSNCTPRSFHQLTSNICRRRAVTRPKWANPSCCTPRKSANLGIRRILCKFLRNRLIEEETGRVALRASPTTSALTLASVLISTAWPTKVIICHTKHAIRVPAPAFSSRAKPTKIRRNYRRRSPRFPNIFHTISATLRIASQQNLNSSLPATSSRNGRATPPKIHKFPRIPQTPSKLPAK